MKFCPSPRTGLGLLLCLVLWTGSCNKETDLVADYVVEDPKGNGIITITEITVLQNNSIIIEPLADNGHFKNQKALITEVSTPKMGKTRINENNTITYTPDTNRTGTDSFNYTASITNPDQSIKLEGHTVTVNVSAKMPAIDYGPLKAFPSAYGAGARTSGARASKNATVYRVTNLNDSGPGSLREGISGVGTNNNRYIVFDVSGTIYLRSTLYCHASNITIAGQTAPAGGITLAGAKVQFGGNPAPSNIIVRYLSIRPDFKVAEQDALCLYNSKDVIFDHVSVSWGTDEIFSFAGTVNQVTMQRMLIAEGNKTGTIIGDTNNPDNGDQFSVLNNMWYNVSHRFPNISTNGQAEIINNVVYNWNHRLVNIQGGVKLNHINNYYFRQQSNTYTNRLNKYNGGNRGKDPQLYTAGNLVLPHHFTDPAADNWRLWTSFGSWKYNNIAYSATSPAELPRAFRANGQHPLLGVPYPIKSATAAFEDVLSDVGNNKRLDRFGNVIQQVDQLDLFFLQNVRLDTPKRYEYGSPTEIPGLPHYLDFKNRINSVPLNKHPSTYDTDGDGMPDEWEILRGLDPHKKDHNEDSDGNGYTNLEEFLNLVDF